MENRYLIQMDTRLGWLNKNVIEFNKLSVGTCLLEFELTDNRVPFDLQNKRVMIEVLTPSGSTVEEPVTLIDATTGKFEKELIAEMITEQGMHYLELSIYNEDDTTLLVTNKARYSVGENYGEKNVTVSSQYSTLQECIMQTKEVQTSVEGNALIVEQSRDSATQSASNSIQSSMASQESAESAQEASVAVDNILELAKQSAEASKQSAESSKASADESDRAKNVALQASEVANQSSVTANQASINAEKALQDTVEARNNAQQSEASARNSAIEAGMAETSANSSKAILEAKIVEVEAVKSRVDETVSTVNQANITANTNLSKITSLTDTNNTLIDVATTNTAKAEQAIRDASIAKIAVDQAVIDATDQANRSKTEADRAQGIATSIGNIEERFGAIETKNVEQDNVLSDKYDDVVADIDAGTLTFKASGVDKKTVQVGSSTVSSDKVRFEDGVSLTDKHNELNSKVDNHVTLDNIGQQNFNFIADKVVQNGLVYSSDSEFKTTNIGNRNFTVHCKVKINSLATDAQVLNIGKWSGHKKLGFAVSITNSATLRFRLRDDVVPVENIYILTDYIYVGKVIEFSLVVSEKSVIVIIDGVEKQLYSSKITGEFQDNAEISMTRAFLENVNTVIYNRPLTPQEIQHNFQVLNNTPSISALEVDNKQYVLGSDSEHVVMDTGFNLQESYDSLAKTMAKEFVADANGEIKVDNAINKSKILMSEICGMTLCNYFGERLNNHDVTGTSVAFRKNKSLEANKTYIAYLKISNFVSGSDINFNRISISESGISVSAKINLTGNGVFKIRITTPPNWTVTSNKFTLYIDSSGVQSGFSCTISDLVICDLESENFINSYFDGLGSTEATIETQSGKYSFCRLKIEGKTEVVDGKLVSLESTDASLPKLGSVHSVADTLDRASGVLVENSFEYSFDGTENITAYDKDKYKVDFGNIFASSIGINCTSNTFKCVQIGSDFVTSTTDCFACNYGYIYINKIDILSDIVRLKQYFAQQKANGTPVTVRYQLATPTQTQLTPTQVATYSQHKKVILLPFAEDKVVLNEDGSSTWIDASESIVLNGTESYQAHSIEGLYYVDGILKNCKPTNDVALISDKLTGTGYYPSIELGVSSGGTPNPSRLFIKNSSFANDVNGFKKWIADLSPTIYYKATPTTTHIPKSLTPTIPLNKINTLFTAGGAVMASSFKATIPVDRIGEQEDRITALENTIVQLALKQN